MMNIKHILSRGHRAGGLAEASGIPGFAMRFIMSLLLLVTVGGVSSVWAQSMPTYTSWQGSHFTSVGNYDMNQAVLFMQQQVTPTADGDLVVNLKWDSGNKRLDVYGIDLIDNSGAVVKSDYRWLWTGGSKNTITYTLSGLSSGTTYTMRAYTGVNDDSNGAFVTNTGNTCSGVITYGGAASAGLSLKTDWNLGRDRASWTVAKDAPSAVLDNVRARNWKRLNNVYTHDEAGISLSKGQTFTMTLNGTTGTLNVKGVELLDASNKIVLSDIHNCDVTSSNSGKYEIAVPANGTYKVRLLVQSSSAISSTGTITYAAMETWTVKINDGYKLVYNGHNYGNNETAAIDIDSHDYRGITVNAPSTKAVWGPIVDNTNKTITFEISNPVTPQAGKWYRVQILPKGTRYFNGGNQTTTNMVESLNGLSQIRRKSNYIYLHQDDTYTNNYPLDIAGYYEGMEAMSYIYVPEKGGSASSITLALQTLTGRYVNHQGIWTTASGVQTFNLTPDNSDGSFSWNGGLRPWTNLGAPNHLTFGYSGSNQSQCFYTYFTEVNPAEKFDVYRINVVGGNENTTITYNGSGNHGLNTVYNGGYLFLEKGTVLDKTNFSITGAEFENPAIKVSAAADVNGVKTLTLKQDADLWYYIQVNNGGYMSTEYVNASGDLMLNNLNKPIDYRGLWMEVPVTDLNDYDEGTIYFVNAFYGDTKVLAMTGDVGSGNASARMYDLNNVPSGAVRNFVRQYKESNPNAFYYKTDVSGSNYLNNRDGKLAYWDNGGAYGNTGSTFNHLTPVPNLPNNATIQFVAASSSVTLPSGLNIVYRNLEFYRMNGVEIQHYQSAPGIFSELQNGSTYHFGNVPGLISLFTVYNYPELRVSRIEVEGTTVKLIIEKLPKIIHRQHALFDQVAAVDAEHKPNNKFIQPGQGLIDHPYAANFTGVGYTDNDRKMQNTSVFHITQYTKKGETTSLYLPYTKNGGTNRVNQYQRWYDYTTERCLDEGILQGLANNYTTYYNGIARKAVDGSVTIKLPSDKDEIYVGVDASEFNDHTTDSDGNLKEPSLSMRTVIHVVSAEKMASALVAKGGSKWWEEKTYIVPNIKRGSATHQNNSDLLPLDMTFSNYWIYTDDLHNDVMRIVNENGNYDNLANNVSFEVEGEAKDFITVGIFRDKATTGIFDPLGVKYNHFIYYKINGSELTREVPAGSQAVIKVYAHNGASGTKYQLAKFTLNFQADCEPLAITSVVGNNNSTRSRDYFQSQQMAEVASLTFSERRVDFMGFGGKDGNSNHYAFPLDPTRTSYAFSPDDSYGGYRITKSAYGMKVLPVSLYERNIKEGNTSLTPIDDDYYLYIDAAESPGQVASIPLDGSLCPGTRLYFYGWINSQNPIEAGNASPASVILELVGHKGSNETVLATYAPGIISDAAYTPEGTVIRSVKDGRTASDLAAYSSSYNLYGHQDDATRLAAWQSIGFNYLLTESGFDGFELRVINNCFSTAGGDYSLDDFRVFVNPPKGNVDFTTPLCSDKVRHAKIHADYDMLKNISSVNDDPSNTDPNMYVTCCFLEASVFDNYTDGTLKISDIFEVDAQGNHNLKKEYSTGEKLEAAEILINAAFGKALVGTRELSAGDKANHGFHVYAVSPNYESIEEYAYHNSLVDKVYREEVGGIRRIVFKEDVVRGEQGLLPDGRWPHMRPSTTYYLVFSPIKATKGDGTSVDIDHHSAATDIFRIHESCSFLGKFTTKDPMHVILDNADIEADMPIRAVCHGESTTFSFDMPAMKVDKPIFDEEYCTNDESLKGQMVPNTNGAHHYRFEQSFNNDAVKGVITNMPYDWWMGGTLEGKSFHGSIDAYNTATHPSITYSGPKDIAHKQDNAPVKIAQAMVDFRFFYPNFKEGDDWGNVTKKDYNPETGYGLLQSEINTIKDFVDAGIIKLHRDTYSMPMTFAEAKQLQAKELSDMMEKEMNDQVLELALSLNDETIQSLLPLKQMEATILEMLSPEGRRNLTFEELGNLSHDQMKNIAEKLRVNETYKLNLTSEQINSLSELMLYRNVEAVLRGMSENDLRTFAMNEENFPNIGHTKRAYLVVRALNILSKETVAKLSEADQQNTTVVREKLREKMIAIFSDQQLVVLKKMWKDTSAKLTDAERATLLKDKKTPEEMTETDKAVLATLVEDALAKITDNVIADLNSDHYVNFTLVPIMPSQVNYVDEKYIFCPEPRGVRIRITEHEPKMLDGFADMTYPENMTNVPVRIGLPQIKETKASASKTLRIPVRGLQQAVKGGVKAVKLAENTGYYNNIFLVKTDDPAYMQPNTSADTDGLTVALNTSGIYDKMVGTIETMVANYPTAGNLTPDNYLIVKFKDNMNFREGYTYRVGINFMENDKDDHATLSCYGTMLFDMKIVPEYQKWTAAVMSDGSNTDWTNDKNWARASRAELNAGNAASGSKIDATATALDDASSYIDNFGDGTVNGTANSFVPMYFTNVLFDNAAKAPVLYDGLTVQSHTADQKNFLGGLHNTATANIIYDMEVAPAEGKGTWAASDNYECTLFGTYIANGITFKPGSQLINAQHLTYNKAWVEYELTTNRWYTLASPLQNTFAGEWYSPTAGGKQMTPHFYDITYQQGNGSQNLNDRFSPAYYQRSWDSQGNNPVYLKTANSNNETEQNAYIMADWSYVYNDVKKEYSNGGFSVMVDESQMKESAPSDHKALVRLPKADKKYTYFDLDGNTGQKADDVLPIYEQTANGYTLKQGANPSKLFTDKLKTAASFTQTINNQTDGNNFFLVANPFMANMDMDAFFTANPTLEKKYWIMTEGGQAVSVKVADDWVGTAGSKVAPLQGFFVKGPANTKSITVTYNAAMQATPSATAPLKAKGAKASSIEKLTIKATRDDISSTAVIALCNTADKKFVNAEDAETFIDSNIADQPTIYTVASGQAMTVNTVPAIDMIPLGIVGEADGTVAVTFSGMSGLCLYDSKDNSYTDINDGTEVIMEAKTAGRYFITSSSSTTAIDRLSVEKAERKGIYTLGGQYVGEELKSLAPGLYIVNGVKMRVK